MLSGVKRHLYKVACRWRPYHQQLLILCYHGVSKGDEHVWNPRLYIAPEVFRQRLKTVEELGYQVLPLTIALGQMRAGSLRAPTLVLTFDDGWHDFHEMAWPILREFGYPATVYQTTYYAVYNRPVFDPACAYLLWKGAGRLIQFRDSNGKPVMLDLREPGSVEQARIDWLQQAREQKLSARQKDRLLERLADAVGVSYSQMLTARTLHLMNEREVREVSQSGIDVQMHTHRHRLPFEKQFFMEELIENRRRIENLTGAPANHFCYPNGEYRPELVDWLRESGVESATTCVPGRATYRSDRLLLPRLTDANTVSQRRFESWLVGSGLIAPHFKRVWRQAFGPAEIVAPLEEVSPELSLAATATSASAKAAKTSG